MRPATALDASTGAPPNKASKFFSIVFLACSGAAALFVVLNDREAILAALSETDFMMVLAALLASTVYIGFAWISWRILLTDAPVTLSWQQSAKVFFIGQIGKYLPGTIWSFLASAELAKNAGLPRKTAVSSLLLALILSLGSGGIMVAFTLPDALNIIELNWHLASPVLLIPMMMAWPKAKQWLLKRAGIDFRISGRCLILSAGSAVLGWLFAGIKIAVLSQAIGFEISWIFVAHATGIYALAWIAGFLFFIAPAGLGAREGVLVSLLAVQMPLADAMVVALLSRLVMTLSDFCLAGLAGALNSRPLRPIEPAGE